MKVSVVMSSWRPGGLDIFFAGMADQTHPDFEILFVDHRRPHRQEIVAQKVKEYGLKSFYHVPEHRCDKWYHGAAGFNSGLLIAEGDITIMLQDYAYAPPGWIERHELSHQFRTPTFCIGPYCHLRIPDEKLPYKAANEQGLRCDLTEEPESVKGGYDEFSIFNKSFSSSWVNQLQVQMPPEAQDPKFLECYHSRTLKRGPIAFWYCHAKNCSFPTEIAIKAGGVDETFDKGKGPWDNEFAFRFERAGCTVWFEPQTLTFHLDPRSLMGTMPWGAMEERKAGRWSFEDGVRYQNQRYAEMAKPGERIPVGDEVVIGTGRGKPVANSPYDFAEKREERLKLKPQWRIA